MSNTEVKLLSAESSWGIAPCEGRTLPCDYSDIAQLVERLTVNQDVVSSSLTTGVNQNRSVRPIFLVNDHISKQDGPLVKWLRHCPFTAVTWVQIPYGS